jgi:hypothetical protein
VEDNGCRIAIGIPSTTAELADCIAKPCGRDLLGSGRLTVQQYSRQIMEPLARMAPLWTRLGAKVHASATLATLSEVFGDRSAKTLLLVSHWKESPAPAIELFDGMVPIGHVVATLPTDFDGVVDLCICQSLDLAKRIKSRCPRATVKWVNVEATPTVWFQVYTLTFRLMSERQLDYLNALNLTLRSFEDAL